jgi:hypothetical protein
LYFCTSTGGFTEVVVPLDQHTRNSIAQVAAIIGEALDKPFCRRRRPRGNVPGVIINRSVVPTRSCERAANRRSHSHHSSSCGTCHERLESKIGRCRGKAPNSE